VVVSLGQLRAAGVGEFIEETAPRVDLDQHIDKIDFWQRRMKLGSKSVDLIRDLFGR